MVGKCHKNDLLMNLSEFKIFPNLVTMKTVVKDILLKLLFNIMKTYMNFLMIYHSCSK